MAIIKGNLSLVRNGNSSGFAFLLRVIKGKIKNKKVGNAAGIQYSGKITLNRREKPI